MFEITGQDISELNDSDLRTLIARLCEAELRRSGLPISGVTAGGDQNAPDGGLDVRVSLAQPEDRTDFIPRANTGFQVKKPDMPRSEILKEMRPGGVVRPVIVELAEQGGAYIIVSSRASANSCGLNDSPWFSLTNIWASRYTKRRRAGTACCAASRALRRRNLARHRGATL